MNILECLEERIAPATATFLDVDGDTVTVTTSKGTNQQLQAIVDAGLSTGDPAMNAQLQTLALDSNFAGSSVKIVVAAPNPTGAGDGLVNVWKIDAPAMDLASVEVGGDLAGLMVGDTNYKNGSVKTVKVQSIGVNGGAATKDWQMIGSTTSFLVAGDVQGAFINWNDGGSGTPLTVGTISIGGSLKGGGTDATGYIAIGASGTAMAELKTLTVGGSLDATNYTYTGTVKVGNEMSGTLGKIGKVTVGGSLEGVIGKNFTGSVFATSGIGDVTIGGGLIGGGNYGGAVYSGGSLGSVTVGTKLIGGDGLASGGIMAAGGIKAVKIGGALDGHTGNYSAAVYAGAKLGTVTVGSSVLGGSGEYSASIMGATGIGTVKIGGNLQGNAGNFSGSLRTITGGDYKIGDITIGGNVSGGFATGTGVIESDSLGKVSIGQSLIGNAFAIHTGEIHATKNIASVFIGKDIVGSSRAYTGVIRVDAAMSSVAFITVVGDLVGGDGDNSALIFLEGKLGKLTIGGSLLGNDGTNSANVKVNGLLSAFTIGGDLRGSVTGGLSSGSLFLNQVGTGTVNGVLHGGAGGGSGYLGFSTGKNIAVGGLNGGTGGTSGTISFSSLTTLAVGIDSTLGVSLWGDAGANSGSIFGTSVKKADLAGGILGGTGSDSGFIQINSIGDLTIRGSITAAGSNSGRIHILDDITGKLTVDGDVTGEADKFNAGGILVSGDAKAIEIKGNLIGGNATTGGITRSGFVEVDGNLASITVGGNIKSGTSTNPATSYDLGSVRAGIIGKMLVKGDLTGTASNPVMITGKGDITKTTGMNQAVGSLTVNGSVSNTFILGGYDPNTSAINGSGGNNGGSAQLGTITVLGGFLNSSIATGVSNNDSAIGNWADNNTLLSKPNGSSIVASIAKIVIKGLATATTQNGIVAERITDLNIAGFKIPMESGAQTFQVGPNSAFQVQHF